MVRGPVFVNGPVVWRSFVSRDQLPTAQSKEPCFQRSSCQDLNCQVPIGQNVHLNSKVEQKHILFYSTFFQSNILKIKEQNKRTENTHQIFFSNRDW